MKRQTIKMHLNIFKIIFNCKNIIIEKILLLAPSMTFFSLRCFRLPISLKICFSDSAQYTKNLKILKWNTKLYPLQSMQLVSEAMPLNPLKKKGLYGNHLRIIHYFVSCSNSRLALETKLRKKIRTIYALNYI